MRRPTALAGVAALFLVGVLVGVLGSDLFLHHRPHPPGGGGGHGRHSTAEELHRRLNLNDAQQRQVDLILADSHRQVAAIWREVAPRVMASIDQSFDRIAQILTPAQRQELERYKHEHLGAMRRHVAEHLRVGRSSAASAASAASDSAAGSATSVGSKAAAGAAGAPGDPNHPGPPKPPSP